MLSYIFRYIVLGLLFLLFFRKILVDQRYNHAGKFFFGHRIDVPSLNISFRNHLLEIHLVKVHFKKLDGNFLLLLTTRLLHGFILLRWDLAFRRQMHVLCTRLAITKLLLRELGHERTLNLEATLSVTVVNTIGLLRLGMVIGHLGIRCEIASLNIIKLLIHRSWINIVVLLPDWGPSIVETSHSRTHRLCVCRRIHWNLFNKTRISIWR